jgi:hypothetical protein
MKYPIPENAGNFLTTPGPVSFSRRTLFRGPSEWLQNVKYLKVIQRDFGIDLCQVILFPLIREITRQFSDVKSNSDFWVSTVSCAKIIRTFRHRDQ